MKCGRTIAWDANVCQYCGYDYRTANAPAAPKETVKPILGGVFVILGAIVELYAGYVMAVAGEAFSGITFGMSDILTTCGAIILLLGIIALLGGVFAIMRKMYGLALLGSILSIPGGVLPGLIGLILVAMSHDEFKK